MIQQMRSMHGKQIQVIGGNILHVDNVEHYKIVIIIINRTVYISSETSEYKTVKDTHMFSKDHICLAISTR